MSSWQALGLGFTQRSYVVHLTFLSQSTSVIDPGTDSYRAFMLSGSYRMQMLESGTMPCLPNPAGFGDFLLLSSYQMTR